MLIDIHHIFSVVDQLLVLYVLIRSLDLRRWQSIKKKLLESRQLQRILFTFDRWANFFRKSLFSSRNLRISSLLAFLFASNTSMLAARSFSKKECYVNQK